MRSHVSILLMSACRRHASAFAPPLLSPTRRTASLLLSTEIPDAEVADAEFPWTSPMTEADDSDPLTAAEEAEVARKIDELDALLSPDTVDAYSADDLVSMGEGLLADGTIDDDRLPFLPGVETIDRLSHFELKDLEGMPDLYRDPRLRLVEDDWAEGYMYNPDEERYDPPEEPLGFPPQPFTNNRFTKEGEFTDFSKFDPTKALAVAREMARKRNTEWLPEGLSQDYLKEKYKEQQGLLIGTFRKGDLDEAVVEQIRPALKVLNHVVELLSMHPTTETEDGRGGPPYVFRFRYHGLLRHRHGMECWAGQMIEDCGVGCSRVYFEVGGRRRDPGED